MKKTNKKTKLEASPAEIQTIVFDIYDELMKGTPNHLIIKHYVKELGVTDRMVYNYIAKATVLMKDIAMKSMEDAMDEHINRYLSIYNECYRNRRYKECVDVLKQLDKLRGLEVNKIDVTSKGDKLITTINIIAPKSEDGKND